MDLDPTWSGCDHLPTVLHPPALDEANSDGAHASELEDLLEPLVHRLCQLVGKELVVKDAHDAAGRDLADGRRVPVVPHVGVHTLHEDAALGEALGVDLPSHVEEPHSPADVPPCLLDDCIPVYVGEKTETESIG